MGAEPLADVMPRVFLTTHGEEFACSRVISSGGELEYDVCIVHNDRDGEGKRVLQSFCNCPDWRGNRPGSYRPGDFWCKHAAASLLVWRAAAPQPKRPPPKREP